MALLIASVLLVLGIPFGLLAVIADRKVVRKACGWIALGIGAIMIIVMAIEPTTWHPDEWINAPSGFGGSVPYNLVVIFASVMYFIPIIVNRFVQRSSCSSGKANASWASCPDLERR